MSPDYQLGVATMSALGLIAWVIGAIKLWEWLYG